jgi:hypothetical protein
MRQADVSVFGVLFNARPAPEDAVARDYFSPLIEGTGKVEGKRVTCGTGAPGPNEAGGEVIVATDVDSLATEFMKLGAYIGGGQRSTMLSEVGDFTINPGVSAFKLIVSAPLKMLTLDSPQGPVDLATAPGFTVTPYAKATEIAFSPQAMADFGSWKLGGADERQKVLILFGGMTITPDVANTFTLGSEAELSFNAGTVLPALLSLSDYSFALEIRQADKTGAVKLLKTIPGAAITPGKNVVTVEPLTDEPLAKIWYVATNVTTTQGRQALGEVRSYQEISAIVPGNFPTVMPLSLDLGTLSGNATPATGVLTLTGPTESASGKVCLADGEFRPVVQSDSVDRSTTWEWSITAEAPAKFVDNCLTLKKGESVPVTVSALNTEAAASVVTGYVPLTTVSTDGRTLPQTVAFTLTSERKIDGALFIEVLVVLIVLGVLLPLIVLYVLNRITTKVEYGDVLRAVFDAKFSLKNDEVLITTKDSAQAGVQLGVLENPQEEFRGLPPQSDGPSISDSEIGTFRRVVPIVPFRAPWFEIVAPAGFVVLTGTVPGVTTERRYRTGKKAPFDGQVSRTWAALVRDDELLRDGAEVVAGRLVIFDKRGRGGGDRPKVRLIKAQHELRLSKRLEALKVAHNATTAAELARKNKKSRSDDSPPPSSAPVLPPPPGAPRFGAPVPHLPSTTAPPTAIGFAQLPPPPPG